jgi:hypothetical protein
VTPEACLDQGQVAYLITGQFSQQEELRQNLRKQFVYNEL